MATWTVHTTRIRDIKDIKRVQRNTLKQSCRDLHGKFSQYHKSRCTLTLMQFMWHNLSSQVTSHCPGETSLSLFGCVFLWPPWAAMDLRLSFRAALTQLMQTEIAKASGMTVPSMFCIHTAFEKQTRTLQILDCKHLTPSTATTMNQGNGSWNLITYF